MDKRPANLLFCACLLHALLFTSPNLIFRHSLLSGLSQQDQPTASELIDAVNGLRTAFGLTPLSVHPILMQTAQSQANALLASNGAVGHTRPGGISYTQQLLTLGYPLAGDLSLGGFRSENFVFGNGLTPPAAVEIWQGDEPHTNTMLSPNYLNIGAGVAIDSDGTTYLVVDTARPTTSGQPQEGAAALLTSTTSSPADVLNQYILPVVRSTARPDGDVIHYVQYGQSLWGIAIEYGTTINGIRLLNNLKETTIYEGQYLLVQKAATQPSPATETPTKQPSASPVGTNIAMGILPTEPPAMTVQPSLDAAPVETASEGSFLTLLGIFLLVIVIGGATATLFIRQPNVTRPPGKDKYT